MKPSQELKESMIHDLQEAIVYDSITPRAAVFTTRLMATHLRDALWAEALAYTERAYDWRVNGTGEDSAVAKEYRAKADRYAELTVIARKAVDALLQLEEETF